MNDKRPRIAVFAYSEVGYLCLKQLLADGANVGIVFTHQDDPKEEIWFESVYDLSKRAGIPAYRPEKIGPAELALLEQASPALVFSFYYRAMIPAAALALPRLGAYNLHGALLPKYRGRACVNWAVLNGETQTGVTLHVMTEQADRGDIIDSMAVPIAYEDTGIDVFHKVGEAARRVIARALTTLEAGEAKRTPQDETRATKFGRRRPQDGILLWEKDAAALYNLIRSVTHPFPGAFTYVNGKKLYVWSAVPRKGTAAPGEVVSTLPLCVGTGDGLLELKRIQFEGAPEAEAAELAAALPVGTALGASGNGKTLL